MALNASIYIGSLPMLALGTFPIGPDPLLQLTVSRPVAPTEIKIPVNHGPAVLDRAGLEQQIIEFVYNGQGPRTFKVIKIARNYGVTQLLLENGNEERTWFNLSVMKDIHIL